VRRSNRAIGSVGHCDRRDEKKRSKKVFRIPIPDENENGPAIREAVQEDAAPRYSFE
jgi:hypothetical protein